MNNPYQLIGYIHQHSTEGLFIGAFDTYEQALNEMERLKADPKNIYTVFRITKAYHWQITVFNRNGEVDFCCYYNDKWTANEAYTRLVQLHSTVEMSFIGGISDEQIYSTD